MTKLSRYILIIVTIMVSSIIIPELYWTAFDKPIKVPYVQYSCMIDDFIIYNTTEKSYSDTKETSYSRSEYECLLPLFYIKQLMVDEKMPDSIRGVASDMRTFGKAKSHIRIRPIDFQSPLPKLHPLFESESGRIALRQPDDVFRISWRVEFINANTNSIDEEKSQAFSAALFHKGFNFPAKIISGIPTIRKSCDEGYFIVDNKDQLFHLKMIQDDPFVKKLDLPRDIAFKHIKCIDFKDKLYYAYLITEDNHIYILTQDEYELKQIPIKDYIAEEHELKIQGDYFNYNLTLKGDNFQKSYAMNKEFEVIDTYLYTWKSNREKVLGKISSSIFPFEFSLNSSLSRYIKLYPTLPKSLYFLLVNLMFVVIQLVTIRKRKVNIGLQIIDLIIILFTGLFGFIAVNTFPKKH